MRRKRKLRLVSKAESPEPISAVSPEEEARLLSLADVALHNPSTAEGLQVGDRTRQEHQKIKQELKDALERFEEDRNKAA